EPLIVVELGDDAGADKVPGDDEAAVAQRTDGGRELDARSGCVDGENVSDLFDKRHGPAPQIRRRYPAGRSVRTGRCRRLGLPDHLGPAAMNARSEDA